MENAEKKQEKAKDIIITEIERIRFLFKDATGLDIMYAYENLVFAEHGIYLVEVDLENESKLNCYFNVEFSEKKRLIFLESLMRTAQLNKMIVINKGTFEMKQNDGEETLSLKFFES